MGVVVIGSGSTSLGNGGCYLFIFVALTLGNTKVVVVLGRIA